MDDVFKTTDKYNRHNPDGLENLNPTPMQPPLGYQRQLSLSEQIRQQIRLHKNLDDNEPETEEEADDFEIPEDPIIASRWENDNIPSIKETRARARALENELTSYETPPLKANAPEPTPPKQSGGSAET